MGFPMAHNLRAKIPRSSRLVICEVAEAQIKRFLAENEHLGEIQVASSPKEVAEQAVGEQLRPPKMSWLK
jgi:3-hydroxyisobutyrate/3-hydroxypropionate dehydrogenase